MTLPLAPERISYSKCPLGWDTSNSTNSCFRVSTTFSNNPAHEIEEFQIHRKSELQRMAHYCTIL